VITEVHRGTNSTTNRCSTYRVHTWAGRRPEDTEEPQVPMTEEPQVPQLEGTEEPQVPMTEEPQVPPNIPLSYPLTDPYAGPTVNTTTNTLNVLFEGGDRKVSKASKSSARQLLDTLRNTPPPTTIIDRLEATPTVAASDHCDECGTHLNRYPHRESCSRAPVTRPRSFDIKSLKGN